MSPPRKRLAAPILLATLLLLLAVGSAEACPFCLPTSFWKPDGQREALAGRPEATVLHLAASLAAPALFLALLAGRGLRRVRKAP